MGSEDMEKEYERIVMDAANVIRDDTGIEIKNDNGESLAQVRPERLRDAIEYCERKGWETIAFLQQGTYKMALKLKNVDPKNRRKICFPKRSEIYFPGLGTLR